MAINNNFDPLKEGAIPFDPIKEGAIPLTSQSQPSSSTPIADKLTSSGIVGDITKIPILGSAIKRILTGTEGYARQVGGSGFELGRAGLSALGNKNMYAIDPATGKAKIQDPFLSEQDLAKYQPTTAIDPATGKTQYVLPEEGLKRTLGGMEAAITAEGLTQIPSLARGGVKFIQNIPNVITKPRLWKTMLSNVPEDVNWRNVTSKAVKSAESSSPKVQQALNKLLGEEASPFNVESVDPDIEKGIPQQFTPYKGKTLSGVKALEKRAELGGRLPSNYFENILGKIVSKGKSIPENKAIEILRRSLSEELKIVNPNLKKLDTLYSLYSKTGDPPSWLKKATIFFISKTLKDTFGIKGPSTDIVDLIASLYFGSKF